MSIVIVSWNTCALLDQCLESVYAQAGGLVLEVFVVDNASEDHSAALVRDKYPQVRLIVNQENVGFARANNQAIGLCQGRWIGLLNSDTLVGEGAFVRMLHVGDADAAIGLVGPLLLNADGTIQPSWSRFVGPLRDFLGRYDHSQAPRALRHARTPPALGLPPFSAGWLGGACLLARHTAGAQVGPLDEGYFMYCEETDWCRRFWQHGWKVQLAPDARVVHLGGQSSKQVVRATRERLAASKVRYYERHGRFWDVWQARALSALYLCR